MTKVKLSSSTEVRVGPITLFHEPEPELPDVLEQARVVADVILAINQRTNYDIEIDQEPYVRLRAGDLSAFFRQRTPEELEEHKRQVVMYDETVLSRYLWPVEDQLLDWYQTATAYNWLTEHALPLTWAEWDQCRRKVDISQVNSLQDLLEDYSAKRRAASDQASLLSRAAVELEGRTYSEVQSLAEALQKEMFLSARIALPIHASLPLQLPERVPSWAWRWGLTVAIPHWWELKEEALNSVPSGNIAIATHPIADVMRKFLTSPAVELQETRRNPTSGHKLQLVSRLEPHPSVVTAVIEADSSHAEETLSKITASLIARKEEGASLLKVHLDLTDQAYRAGGAQPWLRYDLREAAERLGYKKPNGRRGYDAGTLREIYKRVLTLQSCLIQAYEIKKSKTEKLVGNVPYWKIESFEELMEGDMVGPYQILLTDRSAPIYTSLIIQPGLWWHSTQMSKFRQYIPSDILKLNTSGKGNEVNRMAVKLAASLSIWERINAENHGGTIVDTTVGELLEKASVASREELSTMGWSASRIRDYFTEAMEVLRQRGGFELTVRDLDEYQATGRGWVSRFMAAKVGVGIRQLPEGRRKRKSLPA